MKFRLGLALAAIAIPLAFGSQRAAAAPYSFTSSGSFSSCSGCTADSAGTMIGWGGSNNNVDSRYYSGSTMTAVALSSPQTGNTPATHDLIGQLQLG